MVYGCFVKHLTKMKENTTHRILRELWNHDGTTRRALELELGLSRPTLDKALAALVDRGLVTPVGTRSAGGGRPATVFRLNGDTCVVVGADLELPQLSFVVADLWGEPLHRMTADVKDGRRDPLALLRGVSETLTQWMDSLGVPWARVGGMGVALPAFVTDGVATFAGPTMPSWHRVAVQGALEREIPIRVHVHHDTHLMALAEAHALGWSKGALLYVALRPGLSGDVRFGASLLVDGRPYRGGHGHGGSLYKAFVAGEQLTSRDRDERLDLLVDQAVEFLVHAVTLLDPNRIVILAELLGADEEAFITGCRRQLREALVGEFPDLHKVTRAVARGTTAACGAAVAVVQHLRDNPEELFVKEGGDRGKISYGARRSTVTKRKRR